MKVYLYALYDPIETLMWMRCRLKQRYQPALDVFPYLHLKRGRAIRGVNTLYDFLIADTDKELPRDKL